MNKETIDIIIILTAIVGIILLGIFMIMASRWARRKNASLNKSQCCTQKEATALALREGKLPFTSTAFWTGDLSKAETVFGKILALFLIIVFIVFLGFACLVVMKII
ncbi:MAG: hypothetical protein PHP53_24315 [Prolixibacteraceae bacterium]|nr:hypothetical protein [Prolixibacteraceae bacterium]